jgi:hypothetical protein
MRQISPAKIDEIYDAIHALKMTAEVINRTAADDMQRETGPQGPWVIPPLSGDVVMFFAREQVKAAEALHSLFREALEHCT